MGITIGLGINTKELAAGLKSVKQQVQDTFDTLKNKVTTAQANLNLAEARFKSSQAKLAALAEAGDTTSEKFLLLKASTEKLKVSMDTASQKFDAAKKNLDDFKQAPGRFQKIGDSIKSQMASVGAAIAGAFAVQNIAQFLGESVKVAKEAEGVRKAFARIGDENKLAELRGATKGMVNDLELMKAAVQANNFEIPLSQMGKLLAFAQQRARDTGQSVDYLVQSIILGIGRKSPLILDNLGISAVKLRQKLGGISAESAQVADVAKVVGQIAEEEMAKVGKVADDNTTKLERYSVAWDNLKVKIGNAALTAAGFFAETLNGLTTAQKFTGGIGAIFGAAGDVNETKARFQIVKPFLETIAKYSDSNKVQALASQIKILEKNLSIVDADDTDKVVQYARAIELLRIEHEKASGKVAEMNAQNQKAATTYKDATEQVKALKEQQETATSKAQWNALQVQIDKWQAIADNISGAKDELKKFRDMSIGDFGYTAVQSLGPGGREKKLPKSLAGRGMGGMFTGTTLIPQQIEGFNKLIQALEEVELRYQKLNATQKNFADSFLKFSQMEIESAQQLGNAIRASMKQAIAAYLAGAIAQALFKEASKGLVGVITGAIAGVAFTALFDQMVPKFAKGGIVTRPTLGIFGEAGPEAVVPLKDMGRFGMGGGQLQVEVVGTISGRELRIGNKYGQNQMYAITGRKA